MSFSSAPPGSSLDCGDTRATESVAPRRARGIAIALAGAFALAGCSSGDDTTPAAAEAVGAEGAQYGGSLIFLEPLVPTCFYAGGSGYYPVATVLNQLGDKLTYQDPQTREISPWLAESWVVNDDATRYEFTIRQGVTFSDGTDLIPEVVAANFDHWGLGDDELGLASQEFVANYINSEVVDDSTVAFNFSAPTPGFLQATSVVGAAIVAQSTLELPYEDQCQLENLVATGPFTVADIQPEERYTLAVREDYDWAPPALEHQGRAYVDEIQIVITPEDSMRIGALTSGQAHAIRGVQAYDEAQIEESNFTVHAAATNGVNPQFALRPDHPILADINVRQALLKATDTQAIVDTVYSPNYNVATSSLSSGATGYVDLSDKLGYDPEGAKELLEESGWAEGPDGIRVKDGERLELDTWVVHVFPLNQQLDELVAQQWQEVGVQLNILSPDDSTRAAGQRDPLQLPVNITHVGRVDPDVLKSNFHSQSARNALINPDAVLDELLDEISLLPTEDERYAKAEEVQNYLIDQAYVIPLYEFPQVFATAANVHGFTTEPVGRAVLYNVWIED